MYPNSSENPPSSPDHDKLPPVMDSSTASMSVANGLSFQKRSFWSRWGVFVAVAVSLMVVLAIGFVSWYENQLLPVDSSDDNSVRIEIVSGSTPVQIGSLLKESGVIRSYRAFDIYTRLTGARSKLQAGTYAISPSLSTQEVVEYITSGVVEEFQLTFLPGATVMDARQVLIEAGYSEAEVDAALNANYDHPVLEGKPTGADLEGYIYGETYSFSVSASPEQILNRLFDELYEVINENSLKEAYESYGLSLYEGITLASIVQREVGNPEDQKQVAQVFHKRLADGMQLGSDVTFIYAAEKMGVAPRIDLDSPYNTRKYSGLPPGPIASPGLPALVATANPAEGNYLYFVSGDDGKTYFSRTLEEHERNTAEHCIENCLLPE